MSVRLLLIEEEGAHCEHIRQRVNSLWPDAQVTVSNPAIEGPLAPEFLAQAFDAVLLASRWNRGESLEWARDLGGRSGFAPVIFICEGDGDVRAARSFGVHAVLGGEHVDGVEFVQALSTAEQR